MNLIKIWQLIQGINLADEHEVAVSEGQGLGNTKKYSIAQIKTYILTFVMAQIALITKGEKGDRGFTGDRGDKGDKGDRGDRGDTGSQGLKGDTGSQGPVGAQGAKGDKGDKGDAGAQGVQGIAGDKGEKGDQGDTGAQGVQGVAGDKGEKGDQGDPGQIGPKGDPGSGLVIDENTPVANDEAGAIGLDAYTVYITPTGEVRYKLPGAPVPVIPNPPTNGITDDENNEFTFTGGLI